MPAIPHADGLYTRYPIERCIQRADWHGFHYQRKRRITWTYVQTHS